MSTPAMTQGRYSAQQIEAFAQKELYVTLPFAALDTLLPRARHLLRFNPIVESLEASGTEIYQSFAY